MPRSWPWFGDYTPFSEICASEVAGLKRKIEESAWDGRWYLRAYFDGGDPLGSEKNPECKIDSISQGWPVLSMAGDHDRSRVAMDSLNELLVRREAGLIQLSWTFPSMFQG